MYLAACVLFSSFFLLVFFHVFVKEIKTRERSCLWN